MGFRVSIVLICMPLWGCGSALVRSQMSDLQRHLDETQRQQASAEKKLDDLENRVFLLTDQLESQRVAAAHRGAPRLPVVMLSPSSAENAADVDSQGDDVDFQGAARTVDSDRARPVLRLDGSVARASRAPHEQPPSAALGRTGGENLGIAPAPPIRATHPERVRERAPVAAAPLKLYRDALDALKAGNHAAAEQGFREFLRRYPEHDYADNAQYWLGECFYDLRDFRKAAAEFRTVVTRYPNGNKAPGALLKLGYCMLALGDENKGRDILVHLPKSYPNTEAARLAEHRLAGLSTLEGTQ